MSCWNLKSHYYYYYYRHHHHHHHHYYYWELNTFFNIKTIPNITQRLHGTCSEMKSKLNCYGVNFIPKQSAIFINVRKNMPFLLFSKDTTMFLFREGVSRTDIFVSSIYESLCFFKIYTGHKQILYIKFPSPINKGTSIIELWWRCVDIIRFFFLCIENGMREKVI